MIRVTLWTTSQRASLGATSPFCRLSRSPTWLNEEDVAAGGGGGGGGGTSLGGSPRRTAPAHLARDFGSLLWRLPGVWPTGVHLKVQARLQPFRSCWVGGELRCKGKWGTGSLRSELSFPGKVVAASRAGTPQALRLHGRLHCTAGRVPRVRGRCLPASPPLSRHLPSLPALRCATLPGSCGPLGPRPRPGSGAGIAGQAVGKTGGRRRQRGRWGRDTCKHR